MCDSGEHLKETIGINSSLMKLGQCLEIMRWNQDRPPKQHRVPPFRDSKITLLFRDSFTGYTLPALLHIYLCPVMLLIICYVLA
jgi:hypothetical protein